MRRVERTPAFARLVASLLAVDLGPFRHPGYARTAVVTFAANSCSIFETFKCLKAFTSLKRHPNTQ